MICVELTGSLRYLSAGKKDLPANNFRDIDLVFHVVDRAKIDDIRAMLGYFKKVFNKEALSLEWRIRDIDLTVNNKIAAEIILGDSGVKKVLDFKLRFWKHKNITLQDIKEIHRLYLLKRFGRIPPYSGKGHFLKIMRWLGGIFWREKILKNILNVISTMSLYWGPGKQAKMCACSNPVFFIR